MALDEHDADRWTPDEDDDLVRRLRALEWPRPTPEVRERCLQAVWKRLAADDAGPAGDPERFERHEFVRSRPAAASQGALGERLAAARGLSAPRGGHRPYAIPTAYTLR